MIFQLQGNFLSHEQKTYLFYQKMGEKMEFKDFNPPKTVQTSYRVIGNSGPKVIAYCSQNMKIMDFLTPLGAAQMWSI